MILKIALVPERLKDGSSVNFTSFPAHSSTGLYMRLLSFQTTGT